MTLILICLVLIFFVLCGLIEEVHAVKQMVSSPLVFYYPTPESPVAPEEEKKEEAK